MQPDQGGGLHVTKHFALVFGGIKGGSGVAAGAAFSHNFADGAYTQLKAAYSIHHFRLLQARYDSRRFWKGRATVLSRVRWQDAPELRLFPLGQEGPELSARYGERRTEGSTQIRVQVAPLLRVASGVGIERYSITGGRIDLESDEALASVPQLPGLGTRTSFAHTFLTAALDSRTSPDYSRSGRLIEAGIHDYRDGTGGLYSFERVDATVQQLIPTHGARGVIDLSAQTWLSRSTDAQAVPFFLMPALGGSRYLMGYEWYRFRDRNALLLKSEYRWAVHRMVDVTGVYEVGTVAPTLDGLTLSRTAWSVAGGLRVHTATSALVSLDLARGREGFGLAIGFSTGGS
jgi:hypothetical protein